MQYSNKGGGSFATFAYSVIPELSCHLRPIVRKGKSLLFGHISRIFFLKYRNHRRKSPFAANFFAISRRIGHFWIIWDKLNFFQKKFPNILHLTLVIFQKKLRFWRQMAGLGGSGGNTAVFFKGKFYLFLPLVWGNNWAQESRSKRKLQNSPPPNSTMDKHSEFNRSFD